MRSQTGISPKIEETAAELAAWFSLDGCRLRVECACRNNQTHCLAAFSLRGRDYVILESDDLAEALQPALTRREREIALLIARGLYTKQIAYDLGISPHTASTYINRIRTKLVCGTGRRWSPPCSAGPRPRSPDPGPPQSSVS